jgi:hypothetical protein
LLAHHEVAHDLLRAQNSEERLLLLSKQGRLFVAQFEHLGQNRGSLHLGELLSSSWAAQTSDPGAGVALTL